MEIRAIKQHNAELEVSARRAYEEWLIKNRADELSEREQAEREAEDKAAKEAAAAAARERRAQELAEKKAAAEAEKDAFEAKVKLKRSSSVAKLLEA